MSGDMGLLEAQAAGGIEGVNGYAQAQADLARRKKAAVDAAIAQAMGRGTPQAAIDEMAAATARPYEAGETALTQQSANYDADIARRNERWNAYAHDVEASRRLVGDQAASKAAIIDAETKARLALLDAQQRASGGSGGGGGGGGGGGNSTSTSSTTAAKPTQTELSNYLTQQAASNLQAKANAGQNAVDDYREAQRFANRSRTMANTAVAKVTPKVDQAKVDARIQAQVNAPMARNLAREQAAVAMRNNVRQRNEMLQMLGNQEALNPDVANLPAVQSAYQGGIFNPATPQPAQGPLPTGGNRDQFMADTREMQRMATRIAASRETPRLSPAAIQTMEDARVRAMGNATPAGVARKALEQQIVSGLERARQLSAQGQQDVGAFSDPQAFQAEQLRIAQSDPTLAPLIDQFDLAGSMEMGGESAASVIDKMQGGPQARDQQQKLYEQMTAQEKAQAEAALDAVSQQLGIDVRSIASSASVDKGVASVLMQNADIQLAIQQASEVAQTAVDAQEYQAAMSQITNALPGEPARRLVRAYADFYR